MAVHAPARLEELPHGLGPVGRGVVERLEVVDGAKVRAHVALEAELAPQQVLEVARVAADGHAVDLVVARHDARGARGDGLGEGPRVRLPELAGPHVRRALVAARLGHGVGDEVLEERPTTCVGDDVSSFSRSKSLEDRRGRKTLRVAREHSTHKAG